LRSKKPGQDITVERFSTFLAWLSPDVNRAAEEYERVRNTLYMYFANRRCCFADELADETINRVILRSSEESIENKLAYFYGVARNVYREFLRKQRIHLDIEEVTLPAPKPDQPTFSRECLDKCLAELPKESQELVLNYYSEDKSAKIIFRRQLSATLNTTQTALRMRVSRITGGLKNCVRECMSETPVT
jgi:DNA-directed RNA polymerase specialized sigma24 family protein